MIINEAQSKHKSNDYYFCNLTLVYTTQVKYRMIDGIIYLSQKM